jgi:hypothetical protein
LLAQAKSLLARRSVKEKKKKKKEKRKESENILIFLVISLEQL